MLPVRAKSADSRQTFLFLRLYVGGRRLSSRRRRSVSPLKKAENEAAALRRPARCSEGESAVGKEEQQRHAHKDDARTAVQQDLRLLGPVEPGRDGSARRSYG